MQKIQLTRPDDWHLHVRDGAALDTVVPHTAARFGRAIIMPNLVPPVTDVDQALAYRERILAAVPDDCHFDPLMTLYLTDNTSAQEITKAKASGAIHGVKLYPAGATTNSESGVTDIKHTFSALERMQAEGLPLLVHGEVTRIEVDVFDREKVFIEEVLSPVIKEFPDLKVVFEHITTKDAVQFVTDANDNIAATITPHHLLYNRNALFKGGLRPHFYCLPVLKREVHRQALVMAATSGNPKFFLGTDSAPHAKDKKESACGCAGIYTANAAIELYAEVFEQADALDKLEGFASFFGADFYCLARNTDKITLVKEKTTVPEFFPLEKGQLIPMRAGEALNWRISTT